MKNTQNEKKLNWNNLTDEEQTFIERMINRDVLTLCNELVSKGFEGAIDGEYLEFENSSELRYSSPRIPARPENSAARSRFL